MEKALVMNKTDNVATAIDALEKGQKVILLVGDQRVEIELRTMIPFGHKFAIRSINKGEPVMKYGARIGLATSDIGPGEHVHIHNLEGARGRGDRS